MLQLQLFRQDKEKVIAGLKKKNFKNLAIVDEIIALDEAKRKLQQEAEQQTAALNTKAKEIGQLIAQGKKEEAEVIKSQVSALKESAKIYTEKLATLEHSLIDTLVKLPNLPHSSVPEGFSAEDNIVERTKGNIPTLPTSKMPHWDLCKKYNLIDFELGNKLTGSGFPVYTGKGAKLQRALIQLFLDYNTAAGFTEIEPPILVNEASAYGTGQLPDKEAQMYQVPLDNFYLIPTAEVPLTNIYRDEIIEEAKLPVRMTAYTPCFRREAGSYGKDVRGLNRLHQFDKVEIVEIVKPEGSYQVLDGMLHHVEILLQTLELPYRVLRLCGGDISFTSALTFDLEVFSAAQEKWLEVSSVSNFETFQSNRMKIRYRDENGKPQLCHTLNGSSLALPRILASILENNQTEDGIVIPNALRKYTGFDIIN